MIASCTRRSAPYRRWLAAVLLGTLAVAVAGCGAPKTATYVDPNKPGAFAGGESDPASDFGALEFEHALNIERLRARVIAARALMRRSNSDLARAQLESAADETLIGALGATALQSPQRSKQLLAAWRAAGGPTPPNSWHTNGNEEQNSPPNLASIDRLLTQIEQASQLVTPAPARDSGAWHAAIVSALMEDSGTAYENAYLEGIATDTTSQYAQGWGTVQGALKQARKLPVERRTQIEDAIAQYASSYFPAVAPQSDNHSDTDQVVETQGEVSALVEDTFRIMVNGREPRKDAPECIVRTRRTGAQLADALAQPPARNTNARSLDEYLGDVTASYQTCAADIASLDPALAGRIEYALAVSIPVALEDKSTSTATSITANLDSDLVQAASLVSDELDALAQE